jgi:hypothetical protein
MTATPFQQAPSYAPRRINWRILTFVAIFGVLLGMPIYVYLDSVISGGIKNRGEYFEVDLKAMSSFPFDDMNGTVDDVPEKFRALDGKKVVLRGEIAPSSFNAVGADNYFQLVYSVAKCCYSGPPQIQHFVQSTIRPDVPASAVRFGSASQVLVTGTLSVRVTRDETNKINGVYHLNVESIRPA